MELLSSPMWPKWNSKSRGFKAEDDKEELIEITRRLYPQAKLYQPEQYPTEFALILTKIA
jgi:hypothetical protein